MNEDIRNIKKTLTSLVPYKDIKFLTRVHWEFSKKYTKDFLRRRVRDRLLMEKNNYMKVPKNVLMKRFYLFEYIPETDVEIWDRYPLILVLEKNKDSFLGINFHFLPKTQRILFFEKIQNLTIGKEIDLNYKRTKAAFDGYLTLTRRYKMRRVRGPVVEIPLEYIKLFMLMDIQHFFGSSYSDNAIQHKSLERIAD